MRFFTFRLYGRRVAILILVLLVILGVWWSLPRFWGEHSADVIAELQGGPLAPELSGTVQFTSVHGGTEVLVEVAGLPPYQPARDERPPIGPHGFHIHEYGDCTVGDPENPFQAASGHYNPTDQPHGNHAGDLPVLFSNHGFAKMRVFTSAFRPEDVIGRSVIIHIYPDDYRSQPAGNSGPRLACGVIVDSHR